MTLIFIKAQLIFSQVSVSFFRKSRSIFSLTGGWQIKALQRSILAQNGQSDGHWVSVSKPPQTDDFRTQLQELLLQVSNEILNHFILIFQNLTFNSHRNSIWILEYLQRKT